MPSALSLRAMADVNLRRTASAQQQGAAHATVCCDDACIFLVLFWLMVFFTERNGLEAAAP